MKSFLIITFIAAAAIASGAPEHGAEGAHHAVEIPWMAIRNQAINLGILVVGLIYFLKTPLQALFKGKKDSFLEEAKKTEEALKKAELELADAKNKLKELEQNESGSIKKVQEESQAMFEKMVDEAKSQAQRMINDTNLIVTAEVEKAKKQIKEKLILASTAEAEKIIKSKSAEISKKSESGFIQELGQVKP